MDTGTMRALTEKPEWKAEKGICDEGHATDD